MIRKIKFLSVMFLVVSVFCSSCSFGEKLTAGREYSKDIFAMDTYMKVTAYGKNAKVAVDKAEKKINQLDALFDVENKNSEIHKLSVNGKGKLSKESVDLLKRALEISNSTCGKFDITVYPLMRLWGFPTKNYRIPTQTELNGELKKVGYKNVSINDEGIVNLNKEAEIDLGGIAKGYTAERVIDIYRKSGVKSGIISLGGNVQTIGKKPDGKKWKVAIADPEVADNVTSLGVLSVAETAVVTSGGYNRYFEKDGKIYHHIVDPDTGKPADNGLTGVTIVSKDGVLADALSTALFVMGREKAEKYWRDHCNEFGVIFVEKGNKVSISENISKEYSSDRDFEIIIS